MKLPFGLILTTASAIAMSVASRAVDEAVAGLHGAYGDALAPISSRLIGDRTKTGVEKLEIVIAALIAAAARDGIAVVYDLAKAVAQRVYLDVIASAADAAASIVLALKGRRA